MTTTFAHDITATVTTPPIKVDVVNVLDALDAALAERGEDYIYGKPNGKCVYVDHGSPSCLIGAVLHKLGVSLKDLSWHGDVCTGPHQSSFLIDDLETERIIAVDPLQRGTIKNALRTAQGMQDSGKAWGEAVAAAKDHIGRHFRVEVQRVAVPVVTASPSSFSLYRFTQ